MPPVSVKPLCAVILLLLILNLMGCAHNCPTPPAASLTLPPPPSLSTPLPSTNYSLTAAEAIKNWRAKQMATQLMSEPSAKPGQ